MSGINCSDPSQNFTRLIFDTTPEGMYCPIYSPFFGVMGASAAMVFSGMLGCTLAGRARLGAANSRVAISSHLGCHVLAAFFLSFFPLPSAVLSLLALRRFILRFCGAAPPYC